METERKLAGWVKLLFQAAEVFVGSSIIIWTKGLSCDVDAAKKWDFTSDLRLQQQAGRDGQSM